MTCNESPFGKDQPTNWTAVYFLFGTLIGALTLAPLYIYFNGLSWPLAALVVVTYSWSNLSITAGYHRLFAHRAFEVPPWVEWMFLIFGATAFQGPVTQWATDHRRHHRKVDTEHDPYNIHEGLWWAHMGWMLHVDPVIYRGNFAPDLLANPRVMWQHRNYAWLATAMSFGVPTLVGWCFGAPLGGLLIGGILRQVLSQHSTFFINSLCHYFGGRPYNDEISARDNTVLAVLTFGEGYHNYHHTFQADYRNGIYWYQWDPTKWLIEILSSLGLAHKLKRVQSQEIFKARLAIEEKHILQRGHESQLVGQLRTRMEQAFIQFRSLREEYHAKKKELRERWEQQVTQFRSNKGPSTLVTQEQMEEWRRNYQEQREKMKTNLKAAQQELRTATELWRAKLSRAAA